VRPAPEASPRLYSPFSSFSPFAPSLSPKNQRKEFFLYDVIEPPQRGWPQVFSLFPSFFFTFPLVDKKRKTREPATQQRERQARLRRRFSTWPTWFTLFSSPPSSSPLFSFFLPPFPFLWSGARQEKAVDKIAQARSDSAMET